MFARWVEQRAVDLGEEEGPGRHRAAVRGGEVEQREDSPASSGRITTRLRPIVRPAASLRSATTSSRPALAPLTRSVLDLADQRDFNP